MIRVSLGPGDVDCRPYYEASPDDWIVKALVASEDGTFWEHGGVRPLSMVRAFAQNVFSRRRISGASTITMQTVRLIRPHEKSYTAKWIEAFEAMKMERQKSKTWILSQYLNRAPFGSNFIGIEAAAQGWFGKGAKELGLGEAAMLAGMVQAPSRYRPDRGYDKAIARRDYVLGRMLKLGYIDADQMAGAKGVLPEVKRAPRPFAAPHYCDYYLKTRENVRSCADVERGRPSPLRSGDVTTPLDPDLQRLCEETVASAAAEHAYSVATVIMRVATGDVVAMACSGDYFDPKGGQVNTALAPRPAGSTLKPFLTAQAMDLGIVGSESEVLDTPMAVKGYRPANFDGQYRGKVPLRAALIQSLNLPFVRLCQEVGVPRFGAHLRSLGFAHLNAPDERFGLGMAIGNVEVTLVELVTAYRTLAASVSTSASTSSSVSTSASASSSAFSASAAYLVSDMLSGAERSAAALGHVADVDLPRFAWKTGTSAAYRDAWTVAWNPEYVIGVWCGHKEGRFGDESVVGAKAAAPLAWRIARALYPKADGPWFRMPDGTESLRRRRLPEKPASAPKLTIARPEEGATFVFLPDMPQQRLVASVINNPDGVRLWWFLDGVPVGESTGTKPFVTDLLPGDHVLTCATQDGACAQTRFSVREPSGVFFKNTPLPNVRENDILMPVRLAKRA